MISVNPLDLISDSAWFIGLPDAALQQLASAASIRPYARGSFLFTEGELDTDVYCVITGRIRVAISSSGGHDFAITDMTHGFWLGEQGLVSDTGRVASAEALVKSDIMVLSKSAMVELGEQHPLLYRNLLRDHVQRTRELYTLLGGVLFYPLRARVAGRLLQMLNEYGIKQEDALVVDLKLTQNDFARLALGSRQRVNKIFRDWSERGIVETRGDRLAVLNVALLEAEVSLE